MLLADQCFDVWMPNARGTHYSLPQTDAQWQFTFDDIGLRDLPLIVDYVRRITNTDSFPVVCHSQGCTESLIGLINVPTLQQHISALLAMAPVGYVKHHKAPLLHFMADLHFFDLVHWIGFRGFMEQTAFWRWATSMLCEPRDITQGLCEDCLFLFMGKDTGLLLLSSFVSVCVALLHLSCVLLFIAVSDKLANKNSTRLPVYLAHTPAGTSSLNAMHWAQEDQAGGDFRGFDFGSADKNRQHYGTTKPPHWDVSKIHIPVALFTGGQDALSDPSDMERMATELPNVVFKQKIDAYDHLDFVWGVNAAERLYPNVIRLVQQYAK